MADLLIRYLPARGAEQQRWLSRQTKLVAGDDDTASIISALTIMEAAYGDQLSKLPTSLTTALAGKLDTRGPVAHAVAWALGWIAEKSLWKPSSSVAKRVIEILNDVACDPAFVLWLSHIVRSSRHPHTAEALFRHASRPTTSISTSHQEGVWRALVEIDPQFVIRRAAELLNDDRDFVRKCVVAAFATAAADKVSQKLLSRRFNGTWPFRDPAERVGPPVVKAAAKALSLSEQDVRARFESLAPMLGLKLQWKRPSTQRA